MALIVIDRYSLCRIIPFSNNRHRCYPQLQLDWESISQHCPLQIERLFGDLHESNAHDTLAENSFEEIHAISQPKHSDTVRSTDIATF